ncbi:flagellar assembly protein FliH [Psychromonas ingrahamii 37]|uniref:Flagellar assembly protein FliH n=1 Tax=Psychromonas ingrahamii (strain DSM 17664 / CCUG 51855 / 37) TaxID=357804 RepID=A1T0I1_PSYIN|nr:FliH/SctL family protein [Psychromonas ingrahamii]ABM05246.1 flagellar assembly protein FliH [Psychromonas ingrahamii 37]
MGDIIRKADSRAFIAYVFPSLKSAAFKANSDLTAASTVSAVYSQEMIDKVFKDAFENGQQAGYETGFEQGKKEGYGTGLLQGVKEGTEESKKEIDLTLSALNSAVIESQTITATLKEDVKRASISMITEITQKVINKELALNPEIIVQWIEDSIASLPEQPTTVLISLNEQDYQRITSLGPLPDANWKLKSNILIKPGCCEVNTNLVDIKMNAQEKMQTMIEQIS